MEPFVHADKAIDGWLLESCPVVVVSGQPSCSKMSIEDLARRLEQFHARFHPFFITRTRDVFEVAGLYLRGLIQSQKRNMERMAEVVPGADDQAYGHFMTVSPWSATALLDQIAHDADAALGGSEDSFLVVDESAFGKKGEKSVGVARQWNGRLGKIDNCQVGVFTALGRGDDVTLINERLYLGREWTENWQRCEEAGIPGDQRTLRSKAELALEMIRQARSKGIGYRWVGMDAGYGKEPWLLRELDQDGERWVADVHCDQQVYLEDPKPILPQRRSGRGRAPTRLVAQTKPMRVDQWQANQPQDQWKQVTLREGTKGSLAVEVLHRRVWLWDGEEPSAHCWHLIVRRETGSPEKIKYSLSNESEDTPMERLAYQQGQRYWVEHALRNAKSEVGMAQYQLRLWKGWHHHMAMVMLAMLFMLEVRREHKEEIPLLSCHDVIEVLRVLLPKANTTYEEILEQLTERHRRRQSSIDSAQRRQLRKRQYSGP